MLCVGSHEFLKLFDKQTYRICFQTIVFNLYILAHGSWCYACGIVVALEDVPNADHFLLGCVLVTTCEFYLMLWAVENLFTSCFMDGGNQS